VAAPGRARSGGPRDGSGQRRSRSRRGDPTPDLSDEELRALADTNVDPDDVVRVASDADDDEQEASDHDRDTPRDRIEGLLLEQDEEF
jgi:hypothetical protein